MGTYRVFKNDAAADYPLRRSLLFLLIVLFRQVSLSEFTETMSALFFPPSRPIWPSAWRRLS